MLNEKKLKETIERGVYFLEKQQLKDGGYLNFATSISTGFQEECTNETIFSTSLILSCLNTLSEKVFKTRAIRKKIFFFLKDQRSPFWSFNYWKRGSKEFRDAPYPDDLDDTFCSLSALYEYDKSIFDTEALKKILEILINAEVKEGGPYITWIVSKEMNADWGDVDLAVNSNIAYFLSLEGVFLKNINKVIEGSIDKDNFNSRYYKTEFSVLYFISRFYRGTGKKELVKAITKRRQANYSWNNNPLDTALACLALHNLGCSMKKNKNSIEYVCSMQEGDCWNNFPFIVEKISKKKTVYSGSAALTTAFCLELLHKALIEEKKKKSVISANVKIRDKERREKSILKNIQKAFHETVSNLDVDFRDILLERMEKIFAQEEKHQVSLLAYNFQEELKSYEGSKNDKDLIIRLGLANAFGWLAFSLQDEFLDNEKVDSRNISLISFSLRKMQSLFIEDPSSTEAQKEIYEEIIRKIEIANFWEVSNCRINIVGKKIDLPDELPDFKGYVKLAEKSYGHMLGPLFLMISNGYGKDSKEFKDTELFFKRCLIAKQLNDDMHDWEEDLKKGCLSCVVVAIIKKWREENPQKTSIDLKNDLSRLREIFWFKLVEIFCLEIEKQINSANNALGKIPLNSGGAIFGKDLKELEVIIKKTTKEREEALEILKK